MEYERIQGDIFDYLLAVLPEFGLGLFQQPSGADMRAGLLGGGVRLPQPASPNSTSPLQE
jgi:miniconductance mechanosensitive channel